jgi:uncharacterized protein (TIGR03083 family)
MNSTTTVSAHDIPRTPRGRAFEIIEAENAAFLASIRGLDAAAWQRPTACAGWTVHDLVAHVIGQSEEGSRPWLLIRRIRRARKRYPALASLDGHNQCQVDDRRHVPDEALADQFARESKRGLRAMRRLPAPVRRMRISRVFPEDASALPEDSMDYLVRVLAARDFWMHRVDVADAVGGTLQPGHGDREVVAQVIADLAAQWTGPPALLDLTGPAGGRWTLGTGAPAATLSADAIVYMRQLSGRPPRGQLRIDGDAAAGAALERARVVF